VAWVKRDHKHGYAGTFVDDFEAEGSGQHEVGTMRNCSIIEAIRAAIPNDLIEINMQPQDSAITWASPGWKRGAEPGRSGRTSSGVYSYLPWDTAHLLHPNLALQGVHVDLEHATQGDAYCVGLLPAHQYWTGLHRFTHDTIWNGAAISDATWVKPSRDQVSGSTYTRHSRAVWCR